MIYSLRGYPIVFHENSLPIAGQFIERISPEAVDRTLTNGHLVHAFVSHDATKPLARSDTRTLRLTKDQRGLLADVDLPATSYVHDLLAAREHGVGLGWSFAFKAIEDRWAFVDDLPHRLVVDMLIAEVSPFVSQPAYLATESAGRAAVVEVVRGEVRHERSLEVARTVAELGRGRPDIRLAVTYPDGHPPVIRELPPPAPGWRLRLAQMRQWHAEVSA
jgi:HK97 family phage prohead protease